jgi:anti-sigma factor RsiW
MTCRDVTEQLGDYASDAGDPGARRTMEAHLMQCDRRRRYLTTDDLTN